jgi:hypothetical protein
MRNGSSWLAISSRGSDWSNSIGISIGSEEEADLDESKESYGSSIHTDLIGGNVADTSLEFV